MSDDGVQVKFGADIKSLLQGMKDSQEAVSTAAEGMKGDLGSMIESFEKFGTAALAIGGVGLAFEGIKEGISAVGEAIEKSNALARTFENLHYQTGESYESLNVLRVGMNLTGGSIEELEGWMKGATRSMRANADMLVANGVASDKATLMAMPFTDYLRKVMELADSIEEPFRRSTFLTEALGRAGMEAAPQIKRLLENMNEAKDTLAMFGAGVDENGKKRMEQYEAALGRVKTAQQAVDQQLSISAGNWGVTFQNMKLGFSMLEDSVLGGQTRIKDALANMGITMFGGKTVGDKKTDQMIAQLKAENEADNVPQDNGNRIEVKAEAPKKIETKEEYDARIAAAKAAAEKEAEIQKAIQKMRDRDIQEAQARETRADQELMDAREKANNEAIKAMADKTKLEDAIAKASTEAQISDSKVLLASQKDDLERKVAMGEISVVDEIKLRKDMIATETALEVSAINAQITRWNQEGTAHIAEVIKAEAEIRKIKAQSSEAGRKLEDQENQFRMKIMDQMSSGWDTHLQKMMNGQESLKRGFTSMAQEMAGSMEKALIQMGLDFVKFQMLKKTETEKTHLETNFLAAKDAAGNAWSSAADIPVVGWILAPVAAAAAFAGVMAFAEGGWDNVPSDQVAMIHKQEMVLPAHIANPLRESLASGTMGGSGGGGDTHVHISAVDRKSVERLFTQHGSALFKALGTHARNGRFS